MRLIISKSVLIVLIHQTRTPPNKSYAPPLWSACVRCLISLLYVDLFCWCSALLFSFQDGAATTLLFGATGFRLQVLGQVSQRHFPIASDGYIHLGILLVFLCWFLGSIQHSRLPGTQKYNYVHRLHCFATYQADILRAVAFTLSGIANFSRRSLFRLSTFSSKWRFWKAMPWGPHVGGLPPRWAHSCFWKNISRLAGTSSCS